MPEQFALDEIARNRRHVDGDERTLLALAVIVQRAGDQLLAGAGLAADHHRQIGLHQPRKGPVDLLHGGRAPDERHALQLFVALDLDRFSGSLIARPTIETSSRRSKGFGR